MDRNAPERRSGSLFKDRNGVPVNFLEIPNEIQIALVAWISLLPFLAILKLRLSIGLLAFVTVRFSTCTGVCINSTMHLLSTTRLRVYLSKSADAERGFSTVNTTAQPAGRRTTVEFHIRQPSWTIA